MRSVEARLVFLPKYPPDLGTIKQLFRQAEAPAAQGS